MPRLETETKSVWDDLKFLDAMERRRDKHRKRTGHLTFDCFHTRIRDGYVICNQGVSIGQAHDGSMRLEALLRGRTASDCKECPYYNGEEA